MKLKFVKRKIQDKMFGNTQNTAIGVQKAEMADARLGATYMLAHTDMKKVPAFSLDPIGAFVSDTTPLSELKTGCQYFLTKVDREAKLAAKAEQLKGKVSAKGQQLKSAIKNSKAAHKAEDFGNAIKSSKVGTAAAAAGHKMSELAVKIQEQIAGFFRKMMEKIRLTYGDALFGMEWVTEFGMWAVSSFTKGLADLIPGWGYVQAGADIIAGVSAAVRKSIDLHNVYWSGRGVELQGGHPCVIANALKRHAATGIASGIKDVFVGAGSMTFTALGDAFAGAGTIYTAVTGVLSRIMAFVDYIIQRARVTKVLKQARKAWDQRLSPGSLVNDHKRFSEWFQTAVITTPVVAALVMGSGFAAHPYRFLQLLQPNEALLGSAEYTKGVHHIEKLKKYSSKYIQEYNDSYNVTFVSDDGVITARLKEIQENYSVLHEYEYTRAPSATPSPAASPSAVSAGASASAPQASV
ncbi:hypothetical protein [Aliamphritea ceti]|uniref:hypothetical protein n=1 Tax=Aliamphritea ceti TaxID=1524258 RepID=UPI0021C4C7BA|nr:hypothetical protein [Aliamphritea ceti]